MRRLLPLLWLLLSVACASTPQRGTQDVLIARTYVHAEYDAVWRAFTTSDGYAAWYSTPCRTFGVAPGDPCVWAVGERVTYSGELLRLEHGRGLTHTFRFEGFGFDEPPTPVEIELLPQGNVVYIAVRHDCTGAPRTSEMISPVGWAKALARLKSLLERGRAMPWPEGSEDGNG